MKNKIKTSILISIMILLIILIILLTILFILKNNINKNSDNNSLYNVWNVYNTEIVKDNKIVYSLDVANIYFDIRKNNFINICYYTEEERKCDSGSYFYDNNKINIYNSNSSYGGEYKVTLSNDIMILERLEDETTNTFIKHYLQRSLG